MIKCYAFLCIILSSLNSLLADFKVPEKIESNRPNIVFFLTDDHRYDAMGFMGHPFLETPGMDRIAREGAFLKNAFVTTSLCSPSRASILTGLYAHKHRVVDNYHPVDKSLIFFPQYLQKIGYETAFIGKWHMGDQDDPQRGFDHWAVFKGQGTYYPDGSGTSRVVPQTRYDGFNINGKMTPQKGYITDELTDMSIDWIKTRKGKETKPFFLYVSHKGVHSDFVPRNKDRDMYKNGKWAPPSTYALSPENLEGKPMWLQNQRNSRHGVDYGYNLKDFDLEFYYKRYCESLKAIDDAVVNTLNYLEKSGQLDNTLFVYMGDNGFQFGEHGLIDKRTAYEASMRVPLLMRYPKSLKAGTVVKEAVANIDIAPTILEAAGLKTPEHMHGQSFWPILKGEKIKWRENFVYEYFWEWNYPQTPTIHALRGDRYKYIRYHGLWDTDELYDLQKDPEEKHNLINSEAHRKVIADMKEELFKQLFATGGENMPLLEDRGQQFYNRNKEKSGQAPFPKVYFNEMSPIED